MRKLILIAGDLAAGKSTLAFSLGTKLSYAVLTKDELKEIECDIFSYSSRDENKLLSKAAFQNMLYFYKRNALVGNDMILESNFRTEEVCEIAEIAEENNYQVILFYLQGSYEVLYDRFLNRIPTRHRAHVSIGLQYDFNKFIEYIDSLRNQDLVYEMNIIDTTDSNETITLDDVIKTLRTNNFI